MTNPQLSEYFESRLPSPIRMSQLEFAKRKDKVIAINAAIGDVTLPMHPAMIKRMVELGGKDSPFKDGVVGYAETIGTKEARDAFLNVIAASGCDIKDIRVLITEGGSQAMEFMILGCCGPAGTNEKPLLVIDPAYTNYRSLAKRVGRGIVSITRSLGGDGKFSLPDADATKRKIQETGAGAMVVIPYDNPTGSFYDHKTMVNLARICVEMNIWMVSDEAYRELYYTDSRSSCIWAITESEVPGITGRRISIESSSKVWNACGLRVGALVTDNQKYHEQSVAENTGNLCANAIGQYIFGALAHLSRKDLGEWFKKQRDYYKKIMVEVTSELKKRLPGIIVSSPDGSIYSVVDMRNIAGADFDSRDFALYCATKGAVDIKGKKMTLFTAPMAGFYNVAGKDTNPGKTQIRIAYVCPPEEMKLVPELFEKLFREYEGKRSNETTK
jgi:aspartate aminotransferase